MDDSALREQLIQMLRGGHAHATFDDVIRGFPMEKAGIRPEGVRTRRGNCWNTCGSRSTIF